MIASHKADLLGADESAFDLQSVVYATKHPTVETVVGRRVVRRERVASEWCELECSACRRDLNKTFVNKAFGTILHPIGVRFARTRPD